ncbi:MAG: hypothetical protein M3Q07_02110 [Pseudobdellovibrionaceae bacterium]|nr:hypothetical protein [Pseudobdellovibrionaceae bacterium]
MKQERDLDWTFIPGSSANYLSHELVEANANCLVFRPSGRFVAFCRTLFYGPLLLILFFIWSPLEHAMHIILCLVASTVGGFIEWVSKVHIFDRARGLYHVRNNTVEPIPLDQIIAVQLLHGTIRTSDGVYYDVSQLNLCRQDGSRRTILCHSAKECLRADAEWLAVFLDVPLATVDP